MTIAEVLARLSELEGGDELVKAIQAELSKKNKEAEGLRKRAKTAEEALSKLKEQRKDFLHAIGVSEEDAYNEDFSLDDALEAFVNKSGGKGKGKDDPEFAEMAKNIKNLQRQIEKLTKESAEFKQAAETERSKRHEAMKNQSLLAALTAGNALKPDFLAAALASKVKVNDDDTLVFIKDDGEEVPVNEGVKSWLEENPDLVRNPNSAGAGSTGASGKKDVAAEAKSLAEARNKAAMQPTSVGLNPWAVPGQMGQ